MSVAAAIIGFILFTTLGLCVGVGLGKNIARSEIQDYIIRKQQKHGKDPRRAGRRVPGI